MEGTDLGELYGVLQREQAEAWGESGAVHTAADLVAEFREELSRPWQPRCWGCGGEATVVSFSFRPAPAQLYLACDNCAVGGDYHLPLYGHEGLISRLGFWVRQLEGKQTGYLPLLLAWLGTNEARVVLLRAVHPDDEPVSGGG
jgi:hypothetical protein